MAWHGYEELLTTLGRHEEAVATIKGGQQVDPLSLILNTALDWALYFGRQYDQAVKQLQETLELDINYPLAHLILGIVYREMGRYEEAIAEGEKAVVLTSGGGWMRAALARTYGIAGKQREALNALENLIELAKERYVPPYFFVQVYFGLGNIERALEWLEKAYAEHSFWLLYLPREPGLDNLRSDPRYADLLRRMGLPQ